MLEPDAKPEATNQTASIDKNVSTPSGWLLFFGVVLPIIVVGVELVTQMCADDIFDPLPTLAHIPLTLAVPAGNFWLWRSLQRAAAPSRWLPLAAGAALAISFFYALWFLPIAPLAAIAVLFFGFGLLPLGPLLSFIVAARLTALFRRKLIPNFVKRVWIGGAIGLVALVLVDLPSSAILLALRWSAQGGESSAKAVRLMRAVGDRDQLLKRSHDVHRPVVGPLSALLGDYPFWSSEGRILGSPRVDRAGARQLYYQLTGKSHTAAPLPTRFWRKYETNEFVFDEEQGGTEVGRRVAGLTLASSRIEGSIQAEDAIANLEWTMEFANASERQQEARLTLELPPGGVASRATLWVSGEPREASFGSRAATRAAYEKVVKRERRDPLLVTTSGADRLLVQAFPIEPGKSLKLRIGMTAPMKFTTDGRPTLVLPAIVDRNFVIDGQVKHLLWVDSATEIRASLDAIAVKPAINGVVQIRGTLSDEQLVRGRPRLSAAAPSVSKTSFARLPESLSNVLPSEHGAYVTQAIAQEVVPAPRPLVLVVDGSEGARTIAIALQAVIEKLPSHAVVGLIIAADPATRIEPLPATAEHKQRLLQALQATQFRGGHDNALALTNALEWFGEDPKSTLVWIHGAQPVVFANSSAHLQQLLERSRSLPRLVMYQASAGPNKILSDHHWFGNAEAFAASKDGEGDLEEMLASLYASAPRWTIRRTVSDKKHEVGASDGAIARLWAANRVRELIAQRAPKRDEALKLAMGLRLVTPVSGAVVLETDVEYKAQGLPVPDPDGHQVPEPSLILLLAIGGLLLLVVSRLRPRPPLEHHARNRIAL
jgi:Vault protein inter-alpha-trypsin domain